MSRVDTHSVSVPVQHRRRGQDGTSGGPCKGKRHGVVRDPLRALVGQRLRGVSFWGSETSWSGPVTVRTYVSVVPVYVFESSVTLVLMVLLSQCMSSSVGGENGPRVRLSV